MTGPAWLPRARTTVERALEWITIALLAALATVVVVAVAFRKAGAALVWYDEVAAILLAWLTFYGAGLAALKRAHIGFPRVVQSLPRWARSSALVIREAVVLGFFALLAVAGWQVTVGLAGTSLVSLPAVSRSLSVSAVPLGALGCMVAEVLSALAWRADLVSRQAEDAP